MIRRPPISTLFPYPPLFRSCLVAEPPVGRLCPGGRGAVTHVERRRPLDPLSVDRPQTLDVLTPRPGGGRELIEPGQGGPGPDRKSTRLNSSHLVISYAVFCL